MEIRPGSALSVIMYYWPFILSGMAFLYFYPKLSTGKLGLLFGIGVLVGYGVSFLMLPITMLLMSLASVYVPHEALTILTFTVLYSGSALLTGFALWKLGKSLCAHTQSSAPQMPPKTSANLTPATLPPDSTGMNKIVVNITEQDYLHSQWLHYNLNAWRISGVIVVASLMGVFAHEAANISVSVSAGGSIGYIVWYLLDYFVILKARTQKIYNQQKNLHTPVEVVWSKEDIEFISANGTSNLKWSDYIKHKENESLFLLYQSDNIFNMVPKSSFISTEQLKDFSSNLNSNSRSNS